MTKECVPGEVTVKHKPKGCTGKRVGQSVLDSWQSICKVPEIAKSFALKELKV